MKQLSILFVAILTTLTSLAQNYEITFNVNKPLEETLYIGQHFRDDFVIVDSAKAQKPGVYVFKGKRQWTPGIYSLIHYGSGKEASKKKSYTDFTIDGSFKFTINCDSSFNAAKMKVKGCKANELMYAYIARNAEARNQAREIQKRQKSEDTNIRNKATQEMDELSEVMIAYEKDQMERNHQYKFFQLLKTFSGPEVPEEIEDKGSYYRTHYWDDVDLSDHSLIYTPDLFNKMNYYFFGVLYYADADTICKYADVVLDRVQHDSTMMKYFTDFIMPKYFRSTKNVGWDYAWCHIVDRYYGPNESNFALPGDRIHKLNESQRLGKSLIGALGAELYMNDTMQREGADHWISSHRIPQKYVLLWFWDPDCHHCQEQTAALIKVYDSLTANGTRNFEVYAVGFESDVPKWVNYVKKHNLPFINVGGPNVNIDYQEAYNVHGAPTMIILNADRRIIMNKTLPAQSVVPFIEQYEKSHPEQADREPSMWQIEGRNRWGNAYDPKTYFNLSDAEAASRDVKPVNKLKPFSEVVTGLKSY
ncbi:MAG: DUF5106 domain-containing protein [Bacteroidales bacterium]|nr:DUF5106 domain-containing protein [Candidatus Colimorpha onthohippi]